MPAMIAQSGSGLEQKGRVLLGVRGGLIARFDRYKIFTNYRHLYVFFQEKHELRFVDFGHSFQIAKNFEIRNTFEWFDSVLFKKNNQYEMLIAASIFY